MEVHVYSPGEVVHVTSSLYRVVHDPSKEGEHLQTFYAGDNFPPCLECGIRVRYMIRVELSRKKS
jgi:hypothetical protein